jgi:hypothetical protein
MCHSAVLEWTQAGLAVALPELGMDGAMCASCWCHLELCIVCRGADEGAFDWFPCNTLICATLGYVSGIGRQCRCISDMPTLEDAGLNYLRYDIIMFPNMRQ